MACSLLHIVRIVHVLRLLHTAECVEPVGDARRVETQACDDFGTVESKIFVVHQFPTAA